MTANSVKILLIEDSLAEARLLQELLKDSPSKQFHVVHIKRLQEALQALNQDKAIEDNYDVILLDLTLPDSYGLASLSPLNTIAPSLPIVVLTNTNDEELALEAVRQGAQDYLVKRQVNSYMLVRSICYAIERKHMSQALLKDNETLEMQVQARTAELDKAKEINQRKAEFVSMLSHDIRNPLNTILLSAGLLHNSDQRLSHEKKLAHYQLIRSAIKDMAHLLDEVLVIGRAESGQLQYQPSLLNVELFCRELVHEFQLSLGENYQIILTTQGNSSDALWDDSLLRHIFGNLLANAIKYSPQGGQIKFEIIFQNTTVTFHIQDWGIGIPLEAQKQLFQPFYRASNVDIIPGTGLGLAIVKRCVETLAGDISVQSEAGMGTRFTVILPLLTK